MSNANVGLQLLIASGKISTRPGEITDQYVTAVCRIYPNRSVGDQEYLIEDIGIVERSATDSLAKCYSEAARMAYESAITHIDNTIVFPSEPEQQEFVQPASDLSADVKTQPPVTGSPNGNTEEQALAPEMEPESQQDLAQLHGANNDDQQASTVRKLDLNAASASSTGSESIRTEDKENERITKARETKLTILGKANDFYNWPAGRVLDEAPEIIVKFAHRYSGENKDEKEALLALYPEAARRCDKAA